MEDSFGNAKGAPERMPYDIYSKGMGSKMTIFSTSDKKQRHKLTDLQILQQIDQSEDPHGMQALRKIDFSTHGVNVGRKEFSNKNDAIKALAMSKTRVSEIMAKARDM